MIDRKALTYNLAFLFIGQAASAVLFFVSMAYLARTLGPEGFGVIGFAEVVFMFFLTLSSLGISFIGTREVARERARAAYYADRILSVRILLGASAAILMIVFILFLKKPQAAKYTAIVYGLALVPASLLLDWLFQGLEKMYLVALGVFARASAFTVLVFIFVRENGETVTAAWIYLISWFISSAVLLFFYALGSGVPRFKWRPGVQLKLIRDSWPIGVGLIVGWIIHYFDSTVLFIWKGEEAAGEYNAAYRPVILMATALTVYFNAIFPAMSRAAEKNNASMNRIVNLTMGGGTALLLPVAALGTYLSGPAVEAVYGHRFASSAAILSLLLWWPLIVLIVMIYTRVLVCHGRQSSIGRVSGVTAFFNIALNLLLIPFWGGIGASIAKIIADLVTLFIYHRIAREIIQVPVFTLAACPVIAVSVTVIFMSLASMSLWLMAIAGSLIYLAALFISARLIPGWARLVAGGPAA